MLLFGLTPASRALHFQSSRKSFVLPSILSTTCPPRLVNFSAVADLDNAVWISGEAVSGLTVEEIDEIVKGSCFNAYQTIRRQQVIKGRNHTEASMLGKTITKSVEGDERAKAQAREN
ncbi:hypothetical protein MY5147_003300 [Beauveria neobassiana]